MQDAVGELFNVIYFVLFGNEKAKVRVRLPESFKFGRDGSDIELILQFSRAVFKGFIVEEDDVGLGELLARLLGDADVDVFVQRGVDETNVVVTNDLHQFFPRAHELFRHSLAALEPDFDAIVILVELDFGLAEVGGLLNFLEEVLAVQPNHLHWIKVHAHLPRLLLRHSDFN